MFQFASEKQGFYWNLHPVVRFLLPILISVLGFTFAEHLVLVILIIIVVLLLLFAKVDRGTIFTYARMLLTLIPFVSFVWIFFSDGGELLYKYSFIEIYQFGVDKAILMSLRFVSIILSIPLLLGGLTQQEFVIALKKMHVPNSLAVIITMTFKLLPTMEQDMKTIKEAQMSRGIEFEDIKMIQKLKNYVMLIIPLLTISIDRMETMSKVIECRGVSYKCKKTFYKNTAFKVSDYVFFVIMVFSVFAAIYWKGVL